MDFDSLYPKRFAKAGEFNGKDVTLTIAGVKLEELGEGSDKKPKAVMWFQGTKKQMVLNRTNGECIKAMFGRNVDAWTGKRVTFFPAPITDPFTGEATIAIRVRGSPDIAEAKQFQAKIGRKMVQLTVRKTGNGVAPQTGPAARLQDSPLAQQAGSDSFGGQDLADPATGEVPFGSEGTP